MALTGQKKKDYNKAYHARCIEGTRLRQRKFRASVKRYRELSKGQDDNSNRPNGVVIDD